MSCWDLWVLALMWLLLPPDGNSAPGGSISLPSRIISPCQTTNSTQEELDEHDKEPKAQEALASKLPRSQSSQAFMTCDYPHLLRTLGDMRRDQFDDRWMADQGILELYEFGLGESLFESYSFIPALKVLKRFWGSNKIFFSCWSCATLCVYWLFSGSISDRAATEIEEGYWHWSPIILKKYTAGCIWKELS